MHVPMFDLKIENDLLRCELLDSVDKVLKHGRIMLGPEVQEFEKKIAEFVGTRYAVGMSSGSSALYIALKSIGIGTGDEVITTPLTWIITWHAIAACGATPVCVDIRDDFNIDPEAIEPAITKATKAILPMHYAGQMCAMDRICEIAHKNNLCVVEDAAQAFGSEYKAKKAGSFSTAGAFSMNSMKPFASYGEAGAIVTDDSEVYERICMMRHAGTKSDPKKFITNESDFIALNHKMDTIQASMLLVAMKHLPKKMAKINKIAKKYSDGFGDLVKCPRVCKSDAQSYYTYPIQTDNRNELRDYFMKHNIETKIFHMPLACDSSIYSHLNRGAIPIAYKTIEKTLNLPCHDKLSDEQIDYVISKMRGFFMQSQDKLIFSEKTIQNNSSKNQ